ncbi:MAG TPA: cbb3-type cytochrome c oxidase subunit I, partial [Isosphaeraceae bacterium]|nr:cbb3-type cytochrome c oxidase subunit I [Isosphaeraceae bacterium]
MNSTDHPENGHEPGVGPGHASEAAAQHHAEDAHHHHDGVHPAPSNFITRYIFSSDHKVIAIQFLFSGLLFFVIGGLLALAVRWQLAWPWSSVPILSPLMESQWKTGGSMPPEFYNKLFTMHGTIMIFFVVIPILVGAFANFTIPLMIGARDMAFPKLNMLSYWFMWPAFVLIVYSFFVTGGAPETGWTSYPLVALFRWATPGSLNGQTLWLLAVLFAGISSMLGSINYITTVIMLRAPGMK